MTQLSIRNLVTGSYTVHVPKDPRTGRFLTQPKMKPQGQIICADERTGTPD